MKVRPTNSDTSAWNGSYDHSSKLVSLLALAAGSLAMPQSSNADAIVTDLGTNFVTVGPNNTTSFLLDQLPGTARLGFDFVQNGTVRAVSALQKAGYVRLKTGGTSFVVPAPAGK